MRQIDAAKTIFDEIAAFVKANPTALETEADARVHLIDRILIEVLGDAARSVQNCTLSSLEFEQAANITQRPECFEGVGGGPDVIAGQGDMLPAEGGNVG